MRDRYWRISLSLLLQVSFCLALVIPATGYTNTTTGTVSGHRGSHVHSGGNRGTHALSSGNQGPRVLSGSNRGLQGLSGGNRGLNRTQQQQITPSQSKHRTLQGNSRQQNEQRQNNYHAGQGNFTSGEKQIQIKTQKSQGYLTQNKVQGYVNSQKLHGNFQQAENNKHQEQQGQRKEYGHNVNRSLSNSDRKLSKIPRQHVASGQNNTSKQYLITRQQNDDKHNKHHKHHWQHGHCKYFSYYPFIYFSYYLHSYPYVYYSPVYSYNSPTYSSANYSPPGNIYEKDKYSTGNLYGIDSAGWTILAQGEFQTALDIFAKDAEYFPNAGIPKVGYAIASAAAGDLTQGVIAMREAFHIDPDSIHYLQFDDKVLAIINDLIEIFEDSLHENAKQPDEAFMLSALNYLKHDYGSAHEAIGRAIMDGDNSPSVYNLHVLIDEELTDEYAGEYN